MGSVIKKSVVKLHPYEKAVERMQTIFQNGMIVIVALRRRLFRLLLEAEEDDDGDEGEALLDFEPGMSSAFDVSSFLF